VKAASAEFLERLSTEALALCRLWRVTPRGGATKFLTDHDQDITYGGDTYTATRSLEGSAIDNTIGGARANFEITVLLGDWITRPEIEGGQYDGALVEIDAAFYDDLTLGTMPLATGEITNASVPHKDSAQLQCVGFASRTQRPLTEQYSATCRANFCDERCGLDIEDYGTAFAVDSVSGLRQFTASEVAAGGDDFYNLGTVKWLTGNNAGTAVEVLRSTTTGVVTLMVRTGRSIEVGDTGTIYQGCDKTLARCISYDNILNFRGEPYVPGQDYAALAPNAIPPAEAGAHPDPLPDNWTPADGL
jgi:uncharacterized phage protein (TIGR02218 family)